ncbi:MAG: carboxypeptidase regulatory-like domain-containing protein [Deltaproteobacteria bacterium]|nr:carboxypeptidase regulatory-like domain-containing protein [Deltaproteobacteria bacterium]
MNRTIITALAAASLAAGAIAVHADAGGSGSIEGTVVDESGQILATGVQIRITCGAVVKTASIDRAGHFVVSGLPEGTCTLSSTGAGKQAIAMQVTVAGGSIATVLVSMTPPRPPPPPMDMMVPAAAAPDAPGDRRAERMPAKPMAMPMGGAGAAAIAPPPPPRPVKLDPIGRRPNLARARIAQQAQPFQINGGEYAAVRVFPVPQYTGKPEGPRTDFRETIYWNPGVETDARGDATVRFVMSDAVTAFRVTAEGFAASGLPGEGVAQIQSRLPVTLDVHLPTEVSSGDVIDLPVSVGNQTGDDLDAKLTATFGAAFRIKAATSGDPLHLDANGKATVRYPLEVVGTRGDADVSLAVSADGIEDAMQKTIRVVPRGFPFVAQASGTAARGTATINRLDLAGALPGSIHATVTMYPSPVAAMTEGMAGMIREPGGCFEQTSSTNYPNIMILSYLGSTDAADPALVEKTRGVLDHGYRLLTGYETPEKGYEWFGHTPGHEALTAYGLMEFADMAKVYDVDRGMVERTATWLMNQRDHKGGFTRSSTALDSFGRAGAATTNAYIMWALAEAGRTSGMDRELAVQRELGASTTDPYLLALATNTNLIAAPTAKETAAMVARLVAAQAVDGSFTGAKESITMSGGDALVVETTSLAVLALLKASPNGEQDLAIRRAVEWLNGHRGGYGDWGNTQATILGLKASTAYAEHARQTQTDGTATLVVNGKAISAIHFEKGRRDPLVWDDFASALSSGVNTIEVRLDSQATMPYAIAIDYRSAKPQSSPDAKVAITTALLQKTIRTGEGLTLRAHVENRTADGIPMTIARIGIPGGAVFQTWQLKELVDQGKVDFYETRPREVILYWRALAPKAAHDIDLKLLAAVPGTYEAPASSAYLYYTAEDKAWAPPMVETITP